MHVEIATPKTFPAFPAHAQPAILRIWQEAHGLHMASHERHASSESIFLYFSVGCDSCISCDGRATGLILWYRLTLVWHRNHYQFVIEKRNIELCLHFSSSSKLSYHEWLTCLSFCSQRFQVSWLRFEHIEAATKWLSFCKIHFSNPVIGLIVLTLVEARVWHIFGASSSLNWTENASVHWSIYPSPCLNLHSIIMYNKIPTFK